MCMSAISNNLNGIIANTININDISISHPHYSGGRGVYCVTFKLGHGCGTVIPGQVSVATQRIGDSWSTWKTDMCNTIPSILANTLPTWDISIDSNAEIDNTAVSIRHSECYYSFI